MEKIKPIEEIKHVGTKQQSSIDAPIVIQLSLLFVTIAKLQVQGICAQLLYRLLEHTIKQYSTIFFPLFDSTESRILGIHSKMVKKLK